MIKVSSVEIFFLYNEQLLFEILKAVNKYVISLRKFVSLSQMSAVQLVTAAPGGKALRDFAIEGTTYDPNQVCGGGPLIMTYGSFIRHVLFLDVAFCTKFQIK